MNLPMRSAVCKSSPDICGEIDTRACVHVESFPCEAAGHFLIGCCLLVWSLFALSVLAALGHLSQGERQDPLSRLRRQLSQRESQVPHPTHYTERRIEVRPCISSTYWSLSNFMLPSQKPNPSFEYALFHVVLLECNLYISNHL